MVSKYSELADWLSKDIAGSADMPWAMFEVEIIAKAAAALRELEAENERLKSKWVEYVCGHGAEDWVLRENCPVCDAIVADTLMSQVEKLEAERDRLRELIRHMDIEHDSSWWSRDVRERIAAALEQK